MDVDIWRAAHLLIRRDGEDVEFVAGQRADDLLAVGDIESQITRKRILAAVTELRRTTRKLEEPQN